MFTGAIGAGVSLSMMPSMSKAKEAAREVYGIMEDKSKIDSRSEGVSTIKTGQMELKNLHFTYPSRTTRVLRGLNLSI